MTASRSSDDPGESDSDLTELRAKKLWLEIAWNLVRILAAVVGIYGALQLSEIL